jgi:ankyrin repeat protein
MYASAMANITQMNEDMFLSNYPLHAACFQGNVELVKKLLNDRNDVYEEDGFRAWTPVHWASFGGHVSEILSNFCSSCLNTSR